jgi:hypothetical protein
MTEPHPLAELFPSGVDLSDIRRLDPSQRAMAAARVATLPRGAHGSDKIPSQGTAGKVFDVSPASIRRAAIVLEHGVPELKNAVDRGKLSVSIAADAAKLPADVEIRIAEHAESGDIEEIKLMIEAGLAELAGRNIEEVKSAKLVFDALENIIAIGPDIVLRGATPEQHAQLRPLSKQIRFWLNALDVAAGHNQVAAAGGGHAEHVRQDQISAPTKGDLPIALLDAVGEPVDPIDADAKPIPPPEGETMLADDYGRDLNEHPKAEAPHDSGDLLELLISAADYNIATVGKNLAPAILDTSPIQALIAAGCDLHDDILPIISEMVATEP